MRTLGIIVVSISLLFLASACETGGDSGLVAKFESAVPTASMLHIVPPRDDEDADDEGGDGEDSGPPQGAGPPAGVGVPVDVGRPPSTLGQRSSMFALTLEVIARVNAGLDGILEPLETVMVNAAADLEDRSLAVWYDEASSGVEDHLLAVQWQPDHRYEYALASRRNDLDNADWRPRIAGSHTPGSAALLSQGAAWVDLDADLDHLTNGKILALWSTDGGALELTVFQYGVPGENGVPGDSSYRYRRGADGSGELVFRGSVQVDDGQGPSTWEGTRIVARWADGEGGRVDVHLPEVAGGPDGPGAGILSECWKGNVPKVAFQALSVGRRVLLSLGIAETECPFPDVADDPLPHAPPEPGIPSLPVTLR